MIRRPPRSTLSSSSAASDVYKRQEYEVRDVDGPPHGPVQARDLQAVADLERPAPRPERRRSGGRDDQERVNGPGPALRRKDLLLNLARRRERTHGPSSLTCARYVIAGSVLTSPNTLYPRPSRRRAATRDVGSSASPKTIARAGHVCAHAGTIAPSFTGLCASLAAFSPNRMRCTQKVHFSMTPLERTVTSGFNCMFRGFGNSGSCQLNTLTLYGQLFEQYRVPTHRL